MKHITLLLLLPLFVSCGGGGGSSNSSGMVPTPAPGGGATSTPSPIPTAPVDIGLDDNDEDADGDDWSNTVDNCPSTKNPNQEDEDGDGVGNACERNPLPHLVSRVTTSQLLLPATSIAYEQGYIYQTTVLGLDVFSVSAASDVARVGSIVTPFSASHVTVQGEYAYVVDSGYLGSKESILIVKISDPDSPVIVGTIPGPFSGEVAALGRYILAGSEGGRFRDEDEGVVIVDVSQPSNPRAIDLVDIEGASVSTLVASNGVAYVASSRGLHVIDLRMPAKSVVVNYYDLPGGLRRIRRSGRTLVGLSREGLVYVYDIQNPTEPVLKKTVETEVQFLFGDIAIRGDIAFVTSSEGLFLVDIFDESSIESVGFVEISSPRRLIDTPGGVLISSEDGLYGLGEPFDSRGELRKLIDSNEYHPGVATVTSDENIAYVTTGDNAGTVWIVDTSDPARPELVSQESAGAAVQEIGVHRGYVYICMSGMGVDVYAKTSFSGIDYVQNIPGIRCDGVSFRDDMAFIHGLKDLYIYDVSNPSRSIQIGSYKITSASVGDEYGGIALYGNYVCLSRRGGGIYINDITDPTDPDQVGSREIRGLGGRVVVVDSFAYIANGSDVRVFDLSNPLEPVDLFGGLSGGDDIASDGERLYSSDSDIITGYDSLNTGNPSRLFQMPGHARSLKTQGDLLYSVGSGSILDIYRIK